MAPTTEAPADPFAKDMITVRAKHDGVKDNGHTYAAGQEFHMHKDLIPKHVAAGQVEVVAAEAAESKKKRKRPRSRARKQAGPGADKQHLGDKDKAG